jgi:hypothetical protein
MLACRGCAGEASVAAVGVIKSAPASDTFAVATGLNPAAAGCDKLVRTARCAKKGLR